MEHTEILGQYAQPELPAANRQWQLQANRQRELQANRQWQPQANREFKDRLFKAIFGRNTEESKRWRLDLYNALNGTEYTDPDALTLTTIENVIYITMKNDISFLIGSQMNLYEQQSSYNPNMPLRGLMYFAQLYQMNLSARGLDLFGSTLVKIPAPRFVVFYNGNRELPDVSEQRLSDAFEPAGCAPGFEWTAKVINIGGNHSEGLQKKCRALYDYCRYVNRVKGNLKSGLPNRDAVEDALDYAIKGDFLDGFFKTQKMEVLNMSLTEFDQELYDRNRRREGWEEGFDQGEKQGFDRGERSGFNRSKQETARNMLVDGLPLEKIARYTGLSLVDVEELAACPAGQPSSPATV